MEPRLAGVYSDAQCAWVDAFRGVFHIGVFCLLSLTHAHGVKFVHHTALMQSDNILCVYKPRAHSQATASAVISRTGTSCFTSNPLFLGPSRDADSGLTVVDLDRMPGFIIAGSARHIIEPNKEPHVPFQQHNMGVKMRCGLTQLSHQEMHHRIKMWTRCEKHENILKNLLLSKHLSQLRGGVLICCFCLCLPLVRLLFCSSAPSPAFLCCKNRQVPMSKTHTAVHGNCLSHAQIQRKQ